MWRGYSYELNAFVCIIDMRVLKEKLMSHMRIWINIIENRLNLATRCWLGCWPIWFACKYDEHGMHMNRSIHIDINLNLLDGSAPPQNCHYVIIDACEQVKTNKKKCICFGIVLAQINKYSCFVALNEKEKKKTTHNHFAQRDDDNEQL